MRDTMGLRRAKRSLAGAVMLGASLVLTGVLEAQGVPPGQGPGPGASQGAPGQPRANSNTTPKQQTKRPPAESAAPGSDASLRQRVEQLEEQLVDMQVVIGTLESMGRGGGASTASTAYRGGAQVGGGLSGPDSGRIAALETQIQALTAQLEQMSDQLRALQGGSGAQPRGPAGPSPRSGAAPQPGGFGTTRVVPANDPIASLINSEEPRAPAGPAGTPASGPSTAVSRQQYETAYRSLLQQDYATAENGFGEFLKRFPGDELAPSAQFWLGESHFVRGQWDSAAAAFLKVVQSHPRSDKAPDSLAKFAMSMERKGNRPAACRALQELNSRYPNPPAHVKTWEAAERRRAGCA